MIPFLDRKRFVRSLIKVAGADRMAMQVPTPHVRRRQSLHESTQVPVLQRPQHQVPMVWHQTIAENTQGNLGLCLRQDLFKGGVIRLLVKNLIAGISTIENVEDHSPRRVAWCTWHVNQNKGPEPATGTSTFNWTYPLFLFRKRDVIKMLSPRGVSLWEKKENPLSIWTVDCSSSSIVAGKKSNAMEAAVASLEFNTAKLQRVTIRDPKIQSRRVNIGMIISCTCSDWIDEQLEIVKKAANEIISLREQED